MARGPAGPSGIAGVAFGTNRTNCGSPVRRNGSGGFIKVSRYVMLGGDTYGFTRDQNGTRTRLGGVLFIGQWYTWTKLGFWFRVGSGVSYADVIINSATSPERVKKAGLGLSLGVGWDIRVARMVSITPVVTTCYNGLGAVDVAGGTLDNVLTTLVHFGVGVTFH